VYGRPSTALGGREADASYITPPPCRALWSAVSGQQWSVAVHDEKKTSIAQRGSNKSEPASTWLGPTCDQSRVTLWRLLRSPSSSLSLHLSISAVSVYLSVYVRVYVCICFWALWRQISRLDGVRWMTSRLTDVDAAVAISNRRKWCCATRVANKRDVVNLDSYGRIIAAENKHQHRKQEIRSTA